METKMESDSLFNLLHEYAKSGILRAHMPGHKGKSIAQMPANLSEIDVTEVAHFDDLHDANGILANCQQKAAALYGAQNSFFLVGGATCGILSAISAALPYGGHILMARGAHQSAYHAAYLRRLRISYLYSQRSRDAYMTCDTNERGASKDPSVLNASCEPHISGGSYAPCEPISWQQVEQALCEHPEIQAVFIVSPTYEGRIADVQRIAEVVHQRGIPLIVDEAHGAHLGLHPGLAKSSVQAGADLVIHSMHKTLPTLTQSALLHCNSDLIDVALLKRFLRIYQSSSPSYLLLAALENAITLLETDAYTLFESFIMRWNKMLDRLHGIKSLKVSISANAPQDVGKLIISTEKIDLSGKRFYDMLLQDYGIMAEMAAQRYVLLMLSAWNEPDEFDRVTDALLELDKRLSEFSKDRPGRVLFDQSQEPSVQTKTVYPLWEAWDQPSISCALEEAKDKIAADFVTQYPPGIPLLVPGERITGAIIEDIKRRMEFSVPIRGVDDTDGAVKVKISKIGV
ncbi:MAG: PLP-dependent transferase [Clostridium sp.]|jgi:arginine/lysine/ornithine decarboxylase|nr:PLP-dependent transferase [Clostridium sp.]